jgi:hypothetical protein
LGIILVCLSFIHGLCWWRWWLAVGPIESDTICLGSIDLKKADLSAYSIVLFSIAIYSIIYLSCQKNL